MKTCLKTFVMVALLIGVPVVQAAAPKTVSGTWKVQSVLIAGKEAKGAVGMFAEGAIWKIKKNGSATIGGYDDWKWSYDEDDGELILSRKALFGEAKHTWSVTSAGNDITFKFQVLLSNWEVTLTPD